MTLAENADGVRRLRVENVQQAKNAVCSIVCCIEEAVFKLLWLVLAWKETGSSQLWSVAGRMRYSH